LDKDAAIGLSLPIKKDGFRTMKMGRQKSITTTVTTEGTLQPPIILPVNCFVPRIRKCIILIAEMSQFLLVEIRNYLPIPTNSQHLT
jgi:hypothetical protein